MIEPVFNILAITQNDNMLTAQLMTNGYSRVFEGHFPDRPVVPGACMLQLIKDVLSEQLKLNLKVLKADNIKFLAIVTPSEEQLTLQINYRKDEQCLKITAGLSVAQTNCMKLQGTFVII